MKKNLIIALVVLMIIAITALFSAHYFMKKNYNREVLQELPYNDYVFKVYKEESRYSYGSGHKVLSLYRKNKLIDEKTYGNHPLRIGSINSGIVKIIIPITFYEANDVEYIKRWCDKNKKIGAYQIEYGFFYDSATSSDKFLYPHN